MATKQTNKITKTKKSNDTVLPELGKQLSREQQIALLRYSVAKWNRWYRSQDNDANLQGADLQEANLRGADLQQANLQEADFQGAKLQEADFQGAKLQEADFQGAKLQGADLRETKYNRDTKFPAGFNPEAVGMILV